MKSLALIFTLLVINFNAHALKCLPYIPPNGESVKVVVSELGEYKVSAPSNIESNELLEINLFVSTKEEIMVSSPLAFKINSGIASTGFVATKGWQYISITAQYSEGLCGERLEYVQTAYNKPLKQDK
jgi:hypothetical protein